MKFVPRCTAAVMMIVLLLSVPGARADLSAEAGEWLVRAAAYIDAYKGQVASIDLGLELKSADDFLETYQIIE